MKTRRGVEICRIGKYPLSTGEHEFTRKQFESAIRNAKGRTAPAIGIGHTDPRWADVGASHDGEPALGRVENLRLSADGDTLIGDYVNMPGWFADALPSSFARRSLEGESRGEELVITAVKVLGMKLPAVQTLEDLAGFVSDEGPVAIAAGADNNGRAITVVFAPQPREVSKVKVDPKRLRAAFGLPANATDEQVWAKAEDAGTVEMSAARKRKLILAASGEGLQNAELAREMLGLSPGASDDEVKEKLKHRGLALAQLEKMIDPDVMGRELKAAVAEGKFPESRVGHYQAMYEQSPARAREVIAGLVAVDPKLTSLSARMAAAAPPAEADLMHRTRQALGLEPRAISDPLYNGAPAAQPVAAAGAAAPKLERTAHGTVTWGGVPTRLSDRGTRQIFHGSEWVDLEEAQMCGVTPADSALAIHATRQVGSARARKALGEGIAARAALGMS